MSSKSRKRSKGATSDRESKRDELFALQRTCMGIIKSFLEENITKDNFLENCVKLSQRDYDDVVYERSIEHLCGYPLCNNGLKNVLKQQYHIISNKLYDITERKRFCSNFCYKASNFVMAQLCDVPLYFGGTYEPGFQINLLSENENRGGHGEEIIFAQSLLKTKQETPIENAAGNHFADLLQKEVKNCEDQLLNLRITEKKYENTFLFESPMQDESHKTNISKPDSETDITDDSDDNDHDFGDFFPGYDNMSVICNKQMPVPKYSTKRTVLIDPIKPTTVTDGQKMNMSHKLRDVFEDWFTVDTLKYIHGERQVYAYKADVLFNAMVLTDEPHSDKISAVKNEYIDLCLKIDEIDGDNAWENVSKFHAMYKNCGATEKPKEEKKDSTEKPEEEKKDSTEKPEEEKKDSYSNVPSYTKSTKRRRRRGGKKLKKKTKSVSFVPNVEGDKTEEQQEVDFEQEDTNAEDLSSEALLPVVDSASPNALRKQLFISKLKPVYIDLLPIIQTHYLSIREEVLKIVDTFNLTAKNITFKPNEWICIALILFRLLTKKEVPDFNKLWETKSAHLCMTMEEMDALTTDLKSHKQLQRLYDSVVV